MEVYLDGKGYSARDEKRILDVLGRGLLREFPNPSRTGCPGPAVLVGGNSHQNGWAGASGATGIWKLSKQTSAQHIQDALFVSRRVSLSVQIDLHLSNSSSFQQLRTLTQILWIFRSPAVAQCSAVPFQLRTRTSSALDPLSPLTKQKYPSTNTRTS